MKFSGDNWNQFSSKTPLRLMVTSKTNRDKGTLQTATSEAEDFCKKSSF